MGKEEKMKKEKSKEYQISTEENLLAEEPTAYYVAPKTLPISHLTPIQKMEIIKGGISKRYLEHLKKETELDYNSLADVLSVTRATLINKKGEYKFNDAVSERILSLADLYSFGYEIFGSKAMFNKWMFATNQALGGKLPFELIDNQYGREEVRNLIGRIAYGVYS